MSGERCAASKETQQGPPAAAGPQEKFNLDVQNKAVAAAKEAWSATSQKRAAKTKAAAKAEAFQAKLDWSREEGPDPRDPRTLGQGPCGKEHGSPRTIWRNQYGEYQDCPKCALRMKSIPNKDSSATRHRNDTSGNVRQALKLIRDADQWENCTEKIFKAAMATACAGRVLNTSTAKAEPKRATAESSTAAASAASAEEIAQLAFQMYNRRHQKSSTSPAAEEDSDEGFEKVPSVDGDKSTITAKTKARQ